MYDRRKIQQVHLIKECSVS